MHYRGSDEEAEIRSVFSAHNAERGELPFNHEYAKGDPHGRPQADASEVHVHLPVHSLAPIGVFDSGAGGLTIFSTLQQGLPQENFIYFGDTANCPYGLRSQPEIT